MTDPTKSAVIINTLTDKRELLYEVKRVIKETRADALRKFKPKNTFIPKAGDKLWFFPGCDVPRFKIKQFCDKHNVAVVKYKEASTVRFTGPDVIEGMLSYAHHHYMEKTKFLAWFETIMTNSYQELKDQIIKSESDVVYLSYYAINAFYSEDQFGAKALKRPSKNGSHSNARVWSAKDDTCYKNLIYMINDPSIVHQDDLLALLNTGTIMTEEMYVEIQRLFKSSDKENTKVAMEAMANCDFQKSAVYLLLLMQTYGDAIHNSGNRHHVNFKSLIKYFQIQVITSISLDTIINSLRSQKLLNLENLNKLMPMALVRIREKGDMQNLKVTEIGLTPEVEKSLSENILDSMLTPPAPVVIDTPSTVTESHETILAQTENPNLD